MQAAVLTTISVDSIDDAVLVSGALIVDYRALRPPKEPLATLARNHTVVDTAALIATYFTRDYLDLCCKKSGNNKEQHYNRRSAVSFVASYEMAFDEVNYFICKPIGNWTHDKNLLPLLTDIVKLG